FSSFHSGIGVVSGWKCTGGKLTFTIDNGPEAQLAYGTSRLDTATVCKDEGDNGFVYLMNWNLLGTGWHTIRVYDDGVKFAEAMFYVVTFGEEFLSGVNGVCVLKNFPHAGTTITLDWDESEQRFVLGSVEENSGGSSSSSSSSGGSSNSSSSSGGT